MRLSLVLGTVLLAGCVGPHSSGGLWAQQNLDEEAALFRRGEAQRVADARSFELSLADEALATEQARVSSELAECPGPERQALTVSSGDRVRDEIRLRIQDDPVRLGRLAQLALADWRLRRARATGDVGFCASARSALAGQSPPAAAQALQFDDATVDRSELTPVAADTQRPPLVELGLYAAGWSDSVTAAEPLPHYLAAVYGGVVLSTSARQKEPQEIAARRVDELAPAYPEWEPDALFAALAWQ